MGFIREMLQNQGQGGGMTSPQQGLQARLGQQGLMESMRGMQTPTMNLPSQAQGQGAPQGGGFGGGIQQLLQQMRERLGQQGIGGMAGGGQQPGGGGQIPGFNPTPRMPFPSNFGTGVQQAPQWPGMPGGPGGLQALPGSFAATGRWPQQQPSSTPQVNPRLPTMPVQRPTVATGDPRPPSPTGGFNPTPGRVGPTVQQPTVQRPTALPSKYGNLSGIRR